jgi:hypothetical protein
MIRQAIVSTVLCFTLAATGGAQQSTPRPHTTDSSTSSLVPHPAVPSAAPASRVGLRSQPSFWDDSLKMIRDGGWDIGSWLAYRRRLLAEASLTNRYFWFCITSYAANVLLIYLFYASRVSEERKIWKATEVMTDLWNWALYADWTARKAINKYNTHIDRCHSQANARSASNAATSREASEVARFQAERDTLQQELIAVKNELAERDRVITNLNIRIDEVSKSITGGSDPKLTADLMSKVNMLTARNQHLEEQLTSAQSKLKQFAQGAA